MIRTLAAVGETPFVTGNNELWPLGNRTLHVAGRTVSAADFDAAFNRQKTFAGAANLRFLGPAFLLIGLFVLLPLPTPVWYAFAEWVGLDNLRRALADPVHLRSNLHVTIDIPGTLVLRVGFGVLMAVLPDFLNAVQRGMGPDGWAAPWLWEPGTALIAIMVVSGWRFAGFWPSPAALPGSTGFSP